MFKLITDVVALLSAKQRLEFIRLQILVLFMTLFEVIGVISISPFMAIISDPSLIETQSVLKLLYDFSATTTEEDFIFFLGSLALIALTVSSLVSIYTVWHMAMFANRVGTDIGQRLYNYYMSESWLFHTENNSAHLIKKISIESSRLTSTILIPLMQLNARIVLVFIMSSMIFLLNPTVAIAALIIFGLAYLFLFKVVRKRLNVNSEEISKANEERFILMSEGFGGVKDVLLLGRQTDFIKRFHNSGKRLARALGSNQGLVETPRYFMELITFSALISLILYLYSGDSKSVSDILPLISIYALAGFKMLPAFQQMYRSVGQIKGNMAAFHSIKDEVKKSNEHVPANKNEHLSCNAKIELRSVYFSYPNKKKNIISNLDLLIPIRKTVGIVGPSGGGKSTVIDLLMGLIDPKEGGLWVDDKQLTKGFIRAWQNTIGYVPQSIFLSDRTFIENIAFGVPIEEINLVEIERSVKLAHLSSLIKELPEGLGTVIGERGIQLSGGQRQRIGIARALYHNPEVLIFDEATSALDGLTEKAIMDAIHDFSGKKTIVMIAHRLKTVQKCDIIFYMVDGKVIDKGTFIELVDRNKEFKEMAASA